jgi:hypothetical protein
LDSTGKRIFRLFAPFFLDLHMADKVMSAARQQGKNKFCISPAIEEEKKGAWPWPTF